MCEALAVVAVYAIMCATFVALWLGPLYFMDRSERSSDTTEINE